MGLCDFGIIITQISFLIAYQYRLAKKIIKNKNVKISYCDYNQKKS